MYYKSFLSLSLSVFLLGTTLSCNKLADYELVILNGKVLNLDSSAFVLRNIAVNNGQIVKITSEQITGRKVLDASNQFVYPGIIDAHCHYWHYASGQLSVNLVGTSSMCEIVNRLKEFEADHPELGFITGRGWDQNDWTEKVFPTNESLNLAFPDKPVYLTRIDGHALLVNQQALAMIGEIPQQVDGGEIVYENGIPTGVLIDAAKNLVHIPEPTLQQMIPALVATEANCFKLGLTGLAEAGLPFSTIKLLDSLHGAGVLKMPLYTMLGDNEKGNAELFANGPFVGNRTSCNAIKVYSDGALGSRGALLLEPYSDHPNHYGIEIKHQQDLKELCVEAKKKGVQINVHAIGDSANRMVLQVFAEVLGGKNNLRWRIEHAQIVNPADSVYFINYSILPSVQPTHATSDMYWAEERLGEKRINHAYAYVDLLRWSDGHMPLGTDFPVEDIDPRKTLYAAVTRQDSLGFPAGGFLPTQKLTRVEAFKGMTIEAAYAQFEEKEKGSIEVGKQANLFLSPVNLLECPENEILSAEVSKTIILGEVVYSINK